MKHLRYIIKIILLIASDVFIIIMQLKGPRVTNYVEGIALSHNGCFVIVMNLNNGKHLLYFYNSDGQLVNSAKEGIRGSATIWSEGGTAIIAESSGYCLEYDFNGNFLQKKNLDEIYESQYSQKNGDYEICYLHNQKGEEEIWYLNNGSKKKIDMNYKYFRMVFNLNEIIIFLCYNLSVAILIYVGSDKYKKNKNNTLLNQNNKEMSRLDIKIIIQGIRLFAILSFLASLFWGF